MVAAALHVSPHTRTVSASIEARLSSTKYSDPERPRHRSEGCGDNSMDAGIASAWLDATTLPARAWLSITMQALAIGGDLDVIDGLAVVAVAGRDIDAGLDDDHEASLREVKAWMGDPDLVAD